MRALRAVEAEEGFARLVELSELGMFVEVVPEVELVPDGEFVGAGEEQPPHFHVATITCELHASSDDGGVYEPEYVKLVGDAHDVRKECLEGPTFSEEVFVYADGFRPRARSHSLVEVEVTIERVVDET